MKIVRSLCYFSSRPGPKVIERLGTLATRLGERGYMVQTQRVCTRGMAIAALEEQLPDVLVGLGASSLDAVHDQLDAFCGSERTSFYIDAAREPLTERHVDFWRQIVERRAARTFNFSFVFGNRASSPYFPAASYARDGFSIGLQPTNLADEVETLDGWLEAMRAAWEEIAALFAGDDDDDFLGIDSSIAPMFEGTGSIVGVLDRFGHPFGSAVLSDVFTRITRFIAEQNPRPVGLCGLMLPCLEDFGLASAYEAGEFSTERNLFLSLHSGCGIDTYPVGIDESTERLLSVLRLVQALSAKYDKPLSVRWISDGSAKIGERTNLGNPFLRDVTIRAV